LKCVTCREEMMPYEPGQTRHPTCYEISPGALIEFVDPPGSITGEALAVRKELTDVIGWADKNSSRSQQVAIGPSELGDACDRRLGYRIAGIPFANDYDHWPAVVGTAVHTWLEAAVTDYQRVHGLQRYLTERRVHPNDWVMGHSDLYDSERKMIIDWKTVSSKNLAKFKAEGPPESYVIQVNLYGMGQINAGFPVEKVCLVALPRAGWLSDMWVWVGDYDPTIAQLALDRVNNIGAKLIALDVIDNPHRWVEVEAQPSKLCGWCPFYRQGTPPDDGVGANEHGCPGW